MTDNIELVIKIPKEEYSNILKSNNSAFADYASKECMMYAIKNGTSLPKGHGRLIDKIRAEIEHLTYYWCEVNPKTVIDDVLQIIDKYKAESEGKE